MSATLSATSRRQSAAVGQKRPYTSLGGRFECSGRGHGRIQPFLHWSETATTHATSSLWCDGVRGRSTEREAASHGRARGRARGRGQAAAQRWRIFYLYFINFYKIVPTSTYQHPYRTKISRFAAHPDQPRARTLSHNILYKTH